MAEVNLKFFFCFLTINCFGILINIQGKGIMLGGYIDDIIDNKIVYFVSEFAVVLLVYQPESIIGIF